MILTIHNSSPTSALNSNFVMKNANLWLTSDDIDGNISSALIRSAQISESVDNRYGEVSKWS